MTYKTSNEIIIDSILSVLNNNRQNIKHSLHEPFFGDTKALDYLEDCIKTSWVSSGGKWVDVFSY